LVKEIPLMCVFFPGGIFMVVGGSANPCQLQSALCLKVYPVDRVPQNLDRCSPMGEQSPKLWGEMPTEQPLKTVDQTTEVLPGGTTKNGQGQPGEQPVFFGS
jgi:hypothetical protein